MAMLNRRNFLTSTAAFAATLLLSSFKKWGSLIANTDNAPNILLGRATNQSICLNIFFDADSEARIHYGTNANKLNESSQVYVFKKNEPKEIVLTGLKENTRYHYAVVLSGEKKEKHSPTGSFITQRKKKETFVFTVTADSHLGTKKHCDPALYQQTLYNVANDQPDLHFALGDDFRSSKVNNPNYAAIEQLYLNQRAHLGTVFHSIPYYFILGNHELEAKAYDNGGEDCIASWSTKARTRFVSNPLPDSFYTGNADQHPFDGPLQNYYAFEWGDVLFITLDVFRYSNFSAEDEEMKQQNKQNMEGLTQEERMKIRAEREKNKQAGKGGKGEKGGKGGGAGKDRWAFTIGDAQYRWLQSTLEKSDAKYKIVLAHHVMGSCRGGVECAHQFEWGGQSNKGGHDFKQHRPEWAMPIHDLMVKNKVTAFIQGHDHLFARQEKDGVAYITCPMCGDPGYNAYNADAYLSGDKLPNTGHLTFEAGKKDLVMHYVKAVLSKDEAAQGKNGSIVYSWSFGNKKNLIG